MLQKEYSLRLSQETIRSCKKRKFGSKLLQNLENVYTSNGDEFGYLLNDINGNSANKISEHRILLTLTGLDNLLRNYHKRTATG